MALAPSRAPAVRKASTYSARSSPCESTIRLSPSCSLQSRSIRSQRSVNIDWLNACDPIARLLGRSAISYNPRPEARPAASRIPCDDPRMRVGRLWLGLVLGLLVAVASDPARGPASGGWRLLAHDRAVSPPGPPGLTAVTAEASVEEGP